MLNIYIYFFIFLSGATYLYYGQYRVPSKRFLGKPYIRLTSLKYARRKCQRHARLNRAWSFALRFGRQCFLALKNPRRFTKYGRPLTKTPGTLKVYIARGNDERVLIFFLFCFVVRWCCSKDGKNCSLMRNFFAYGYFCKM